MIVEPSGPIIAVLGPTAVGKSNLAMRLAEEFGGDIVSADSRQVYRYLDVGTAKPSIEEQARVRHYMLDLVEPSESYSAQRYAHEGESVLRRLATLGRPAFIVGGTGFYVRALLDGLALPDVAPQAHLRERLRTEAAAEGAAALHERLQSLDPVSAARIHPNNLPRLIRALEIVEVTGAPVPTNSTSEGRATLFLGLDMDRAVLHDIADRRVSDQVRAGLVEESRLALDMGYDPSSPALSGFGYQQMIDYLAGRSTLAEAIDAYRTATHGYIRRQLTWFRADKRIAWLDAQDDPYAAARSLIEQWLDTQGTASGDACP